MNQKEMLMIESLKSTIDNKKIYSYFSDIERELLQKYYKVYTREMYREMVGGMRLDVPKSKLDKLIELKGEGTWEFDGMIDTGARGNDHCTLGHPLRYCYYAKNIQNGNTLKFGVVCVGDFFEIDQRCLKALKGIKDNMVDEMKEIIAIRELNLKEEYYKEKGGRYITIVNTVGTGKLNKSKRYLIADEFIKLGLVVPESLLDKVNEDEYLDNVLLDITDSKMDIRKLRFSEGELQKDVALILKNLCREFDIITLAKLQGTVVEGSWWYSQFNGKELTFVRAMIKSMDYIAREFINKEREIDIRLGWVKESKGNYKFFDRDRQEVIDRFCELILYIKQGGNIAKKELNSKIGDISELVMNSDVSSVCSDITYLIRESYVRGGVNTIDKSVYVRSTLRHMDVYNNNLLSIAKDIVVTKNLNRDSMTVKQYAIIERAYSELNKGDKLNYLKAKLSKVKKTNTNKILTIAKDIVVSKGMRYYDMSDKQRVIVDKAYVHYKSKERC